MVWPVCGIIGEAVHVLRMVVDYNCYSTIYTYGSVAAGWDFYAMNAQNVTHVLGFW